MDRSISSFARRRLLPGAHIGFLMTVTLAACGDSNPTEPDIDDPNDAIAFLRVVTSTDGLLLDPDGYAISVDDGTPADLTVNGERFIQVDPGFRTMAFTGQAANCTPHGNPNLGMSVSGGDTTTVEFAVTCFRDPVAVGMLPNPDAGWQIYVMDASGGPSAPLTTLPGMDNNFLTAIGSAINPDRTHIAFQSNDDNDGLGEYDAFVMALNKSDFVSTGLPGPEFAPAWSSDGTKVVFAGYTWGESSKIFVASPDFTSLDQITPEGDAWDNAPTFSPDGTRIAHQQDSDIYVMDVDGSNRVNLSAGASRPEGSVDLISSWSADGTRVLFKRWAEPPVDTAALWIADVDGSNASYLTSQVSPFAGLAAFGPDGRIYYTRCPDGGECSTKDVWVMNADGSGASALTTSGNEAFSGSFNPTRTFEGTAAPGQWLISVQNPLSEDGVIFRMGLDGSDKTELVSGIVDNVRWN